MSAVRNKNLRPKNLPVDSVTTLNFQNNSNASSAANSNNNQNITSKLRPLTATKRNLGPYTPRVENLKNRVKRIKQQLPSVRNVRPATKRAPNTAGPRPSPNVRPATKKRKIIPNRNGRPATANNKNNATRIIKNSKKQIENNKKSLLNIRKTIQKAQNTLKTIKKTTPVATNNRVLTPRKRRKPNRYEPTPIPAKKPKRQQPQTVRVTNANANARARANAKANANANAKANAAALEAKGRNNANAKANATKVNANKKTKNKVQALSYEKAKSKIIEMSKNPDIKKEVRTLMEKHGIGESEAKKVSSSRSAYAWAILYSIFEDMSGPLYNSKSMNEMVNTERKLRRLHSSLVLINRYKSGTKSTPNFEDDDVEITEEDMVNFLFLMWLDAVHDEYISMSFVSFLESPMCTTYFTANHLNKARDYIKKMENTLIKNRKTVTAAKKPLRSNDKNRYNSSNNFRYAKAAKNRNEKSKELSKKNTNTLISKIVTLVPAVYEHIYKTKSNLKGKYERILKENLDILFGISKNAIDGPDCLNTPSVMYVSLDQEGRDTRTLSTIISKSKNMRNYITSGVLIDPGRTMHPIGITKEIKGLQKYIHSNKNSYDFKSIYHVYPYKINIKHNKQKFLNIEFTVSARGLMTAPSKDPKSYFGLKINPANAGKRHGIVTLGASGGEAKKNERAAMGKFLGDGLQYILIASQNKKKPKNKRVFATGDGMASVLAAFFAKRIFNVAPNIMVDLSLNSGDVIMYSDSTFKNSTNCSNKKPLPQKNHSGNTGQASMNWGNNNNNVTSK